MRKTLLEEHVRETRSLYAENILNQWEYKKENFWQVVPKETLALLPHPLDDAEENRRAATAS